MADFIKKQSVAFYVMAVVVILSIVTACLYGASMNDPYFFEVKPNGAITAFLVLAAVFGAGLMVFAQFFRGTKWAKIAVDAAMVAVAVFLMIALLLFFKDRVYYMAIVYGSDLEAGNDAAFAAMNSSMAAIAVNGVAVLAGVVAAFFSVRRREA